MPREPLRIYELIEKLQHAATILGDTAQVYDENGHPFDVSIDNGASSISHNVRTGVLLSPCK